MKINKKYLINLNKLLKFFIHFEKINKKFLLQIFNAFFFHLKKLLIFLAYILYIFIYKKYLKNNPRLKYIKYDRKNSKKNLFLFI